MHTSLQLPMFAGTIKELVVSRMGIGVGPNSLLLSLRRVFGTNVRRIHLLREDVPPEERGQCIQSQAGWAYRTGTWRDNTSEVQLDEVEAMLCRYNRHARDVVLVEDGEFKEQDARAFMIRPCSTTHTNVYSHVREVLRHHRDGRLMMNDGLKGALDELYSGNYTVSGPSRDFLRLLVDRAGEYFPELEYISVCLWTTSIGRGNTTGTAQVVV
ncbi:hypothetical protein B0I37DRAFT_378063 [Chaetomium sp. MPI-CAGE-AT-0009]|nr:hypothetical protein B0I37DRAFT_378063 [Chaetomium sp. MPI-CAGE-AT-0009]